MLWCWWQHQCCVCMCMCLLLQVIAVICVLVWIMNINRFSDPALGGWMSGKGSWCVSVCVCVWGGGGVSR